MILLERLSQELQRDAISLLYLKYLKTFAPQVSEKDNKAKSGNLGGIFVIIGAQMGAGGVTDG